MRILIVDDTVILGAAIARILSRLGEARHVATLEEARRLIEIEDFHLILSDVMLDLGTGADLHFWVAQNHPEKLGCIAFMSGGIPDYATWEYIQKSGAPFLAKPMTLESLVTLATRFA